MPRPGNRTERLELRLEPETIALIDDLRRAEPELPSRAEILRRLVHQAAEQLAARRPRKPRA